MTKMTSTLVVAIVFLVLALFIQRCNNGVYDKPKIDTIKTIDTFYVQTTGEVKYIPKPYKVEVPIVKDTTIYITDTSLAGYKEAYFKLAYQLLTKNYYNDTVSVSDTSGLKGWVNIKDTIYKNKLQGRSINYDIVYPKIKETIIINKPEKKKTLWFVGGGVLFNYPLQNVGIELNGGFLNKKNQFYEIGVQNWNTQLIYKLGTKIKL